MATVFASDQSSSWQAQAHCTPTIKPPASLPTIRAVSSLALTCCIRPLGVSLSQLPADAYSSAEI